MDYPEALCCGGNYCRQLPDIKISSFSQFKSTSFSKLLNESHKILFTFSVARSTSSKPNDIVASELRVHRLYSTSSTKCLQPDER